MPPPQPSSSSPFLSPSPPRRMKFGRRWYRGVVTDHDVSTDAELIWHAQFDDGGECDLNLVELLPVLLPETHLLSPSISQNQALPYPLLHPPIPSPTSPTFTIFHPLPNHQRYPMHFHPIPNRKRYPTSSHPILSLPPLLLRPHPKLFFPLATPPNKSVPNRFLPSCERYELKIDYVAMDQVCTWSHY